MSHTLSFSLDFTGAIDLVSLFWRMGLFPSHLHCLIVPGSGIDMSFGVC